MISILDLIIAEKLKNKEKDQAEEVAIELYQTPQEKDIKNEERSIIIELF